MSPLAEATISIGELSTRTGVSVRALRYYEQQHMLPATRTGTGHRRFNPASAETVRRIRLFLNAGLPLAIIARVLPCFTDEGARLHACVAEYLHHRLDSVRAQIEELDGQRSTIERLQQLIDA